MRRFAILFFCAAAFGQYNGNGVRVLQSTTWDASCPFLSCTAGPTSYTGWSLPGVNAGDLLLWTTLENSPIETATFASTRGETWNTTNHNGANTGIWFAWGVPTTSGPDAFTMTSTTHFALDCGASACTQISELQTPSGVTGWSQDGSTCTNTVTQGSNNVVTVSCNVTTTGSGEIIVAATQQQTANSNLGMDPIYPAQVAACQGNQVCTLFELAPTPGTYTISFFANCGNAPGSCTTSQASIIAMALKPSSGVAIATTSIPNAARSVSYFVQLSEYGGSSAATPWSITSGSLPSGMSLSSSTGAISGTTTAATGNYNFTVQWTDGTHTATKSLSLALNNVQNTPSIVHQAYGDGTSAGGSGGVPVTDSAVFGAGVNSTAGNVIVVATNSWERHQDQGLFSSAAFAGLSPNTPISDNFGDTYYGPAQPVSGTNPWQFFCATLGSTGVLNLTFYDPNKGDSTTGTWVFEMSNVQCPLDDATGVFVSNTPDVANTPYSLTQTFTPGTPNTFMLTVMKGAINATPTVAANSPLGLLDSHVNGFEMGFWLADDSALSSATSLGYSITAPSGGGGFGSCTFAECEHDWLTTMGLRPSTSGSGGGGGGANPHKVRVY